MKEFLASKDEDEAGRCWREMDVSFYGHELIFAMLVAAFENPAKSEQLMQLIKRFEKSGEVSQVCICPACQETCKSCSIGFLL